MRHPSNYESEEAWAANNLDHSLIMGKPGVVSAMAGTKIKNGVDTGIPCIVVGVVKKKAVKDIAPKDLISEKIPGATKELITDIVEVPEIKALSTCLTTEDACGAHGDKHRPLIGGVSIGPITKSGGLWWYGTGGVMVKDLSDDSVVMLTNQHVSGAVGGSISQPAISDFGNYGDVTRNVFGTVKRAVTPAGTGNEVDCAIIGLVEQAETSILDIGDGPFIFADMDDLYAGMTGLTKSGRTTGTTETGVLSDLACSINVNYPTYTASFVDQIKVTAASRFIREGDSGSALLAEVFGTDRIIGLLFASADDGTTAYANPIDVVASSLNIGSLNRVVVQCADEIAFGSGFTMRIKNDITATAATLALMDPGSWQSFIGADTGVNPSYMYAQLYDAAGHLEIVLVDIQESTAGSVKIFRGQEGTTARAWPAGTPLVQSISAATLAHFLQKPEYRTTLVNPNGIVSPLYAGEKIWEAGSDACHKRWWIACESNNSHYWTPMNGGACDDEVSLPTYEGDYPPVIVNADTVLTMKCEFRCDGYVPECGDYWSVDVTLPASGGAFMAPISGEAHCDDGVDSEGTYICGLITGFYDGAGNVSGKAQITFPGTALYRTEYYSGALTFEDWTESTRSVTNVVGGCVGQFRTTITFDPTEE